VPLLAYLPEWTLAMRSAQRSPRTVASYTAGVRSLARWLDANAPDPVGSVDLTPSHVRGWLTELTERGAAPKTIGARYQAGRAGRCSTDTPPRTLPSAPAPNADASPSGTRSERR
jgi:hypothetical protein